MEEKQIAIQKISDNGMLFLPKTLRNKLNCCKGDFIVFREVDGKVYITTKKESEILENL